MQGGFYIKSRKYLALVLLICFSLFFPKNTRSETQAQIIERVITISEQRQELQTQVDTFTAQITFLEQYIAATNLAIAENKIKIEENQQKLKAEQKKLAEFLKVIYEQNQVSLLENIFTTNNFSDFVSKNEYLDSAREKIKESTDKINKIKSQLEEQKRELGEITVQNTLARVSLEKQKSEKETELAKVTQEEIRIRDKYAERLTKIGTGSDYCKKDGKFIKAKYSVFNFPTDCGYISQGFGNTEFASIDKAYNGAIHNGFDVGVNTGTLIKSIGPGTVYAKGASPSGGWGNWVMIKQDKVKIGNSEVEFYSLYAHLVIETHLKVGDRVASGNIVGFVGGTPYWPPHLHFSLFVSSSSWEDGKTGPYPGNVVDPLDYMDIPVSTVGTDWDPKYAH